MAISVLRRACFHVSSSGWGSPVTKPLSQAELTVLEGWKLAPEGIEIATTQEGLGRRWALPVCESTPGQLTLACGTGARAEPFWLGVVCSLGPWPPCLRVLKLARPHCSISSCTHAHWHAKRRFSLLAQARHTETCPQPCLHGVTAGPQCESWFLHILLNTT